MVSTALNPSDIAYYAQELLLCINLSQTEEFSKLLSNTQLHLTAPKNLVALCETRLDADGHTLLKAAAQKGTQSYFAMTLNEKYAKAKVTLQVEQTSSSAAPATEKSSGSFLAWLGLTKSSVSNQNKSKSNLDRRTCSDISHESTVTVAESSKSSSKSRSTSFS